MTTTQKMARKLMTGAAVMLGFAMLAQAGEPERWLHVKVIDSGEGESVNVNVPLSMAEKILPTINENNFHHGKVQIENANMNDIDLAALLDAIRTSPDNEFVTVQSKEDNVRVAKQNGNLVIHVIENGSDGRKEDTQKVDVTVPMRVVNALVAQGNHELDLTAAVHELGQIGDATLVTVEEATQSVRIWVDSHNTAN